MRRYNRFQNTIEKKNSHRDYSANGVKEIYIQNIANNHDSKSLTINMNKTVKDLKKEIEKLFNLNYSLDDYSLRVKINGMNAGFLIQEEDENKTLFDNHFKTHCIVQFGKEKNRGG